MQNWQRLAQSREEQVQQLKVKLLLSETEAKGRLDQTQKVLVGVEAVIERSLTEGWSMVLEGIHLVPGMVPVQIDGALVIHLVLRKQQRAQDIVALPVGVFHEAYGKPGR